MEVNMTRRLQQTRNFIAIIALALSLANYPNNDVHAGDSLYGKITAVKQANLVTIDYGAGTYDIYIVGVDIPAGRSASDEATQFVSNLILNKYVRLRFDGRTPDGKMVGRILTDDPNFGIKDIGVEMVRSGLAIRQPDYRGYVYGEMSAAEAEARQAQHGFWRMAPR